MSAAVIVNDWLSIIWPDPELSLTDPVTPSIIPALLVLLILKLTVEYLVVQYSTETVLDVVSESIENISDSPNPPVRVLPEFKSSSEKVSR